MNIYTLLTGLICLSALFAYLNQWFIKLPFVIGLFTLSTPLSLIILSSKFCLNIPIEQTKNNIELLQIDKVILNVMLGVLLFAGALHTNWNDLKKQIIPISIFAIGGVLLSTVMIALLFKETTSLLIYKLNLFIVSFLEH